MSLTKQDLTDIRDVVLDALEVAVNPRLDNLEIKVDRLEGRMDGLEGQMEGLDRRMEGLEGRMAAQESGQRETNHRLSSIEASLENIDGRLLALEADIKQLYKMLGAKNVALSKKFSALPPEQKLRTLHGELLNLAKQLHVEL